jgi:long-subunit fatty acid transport protein
MYLRILVASAALVALASPPAQAGSLFKLFDGCHFAFQTQCAKNVTKGDHNKARIDQDQWGLGFQFGAQFQHGDNNNAYTGQTGTNDFALTVQNGNNYTSFTSQDGTNQASVTVQSGNGLWGASTTGGNGNVTALVQAN